MASKFYYKFVDEKCISKFETLTDLGHANYKQLAVC